jgi:hypothetical protein
MQVAYIMLLRGVFIGVLHFMICWYSHALPTQPLQNNTFAPPLTHTRVRLHTQLHPTGSSSVHSAVRFASACQSTGPCSVSCIPLSRSPTTRPVASHSTPGQAQVHALLPVQPIRGPYGMLVTLAFHASSVFVSGVGAGMWVGLHCAVAGGGEHVNVMLRGCWVEQSRPAAGSECGNTWSEKQSEQR